MTLQSARKALAAALDRTDRLRADLARAQREVARLRNEVSECEAWEVPVAPDGGFQGEFVPGVRVGWPNVAQDEDTPGSVG